MDHRLGEFGVPGSGTGPADAGASWAKTGGNPSEERKLCTWEKTDGGAGRTLSSDRMMRDWTMAALRLIEEVLIRVLASSHTVSSEATTATTTPRIESTEPSSPRWSVGEGEIAHQAAGDAADHGHAQHGPERDGGPGRLGVDAVHRHRGQPGTEVEADQKSAERQHQDDGTEPQPLDGGGGHDDQHDHVDQDHPANHPAVPGVAGGERSEYQHHRANGRRPGSRPGRHHRHRPTVARWRNDAT